MAIPNQAVKVVFSGALPGGEQWSTSVWVQNFTNLGVTDLSNLLTQLDTDMNAGGAFYAKWAAYVSAGVTLTTIRGYQYQGGSQAAVSAQITSVRAPASAGLLLPNQIAVVTSLRTGIPGRAARGRMYWPVNATPALTTGFFSAACATDLANGLATAFGTFNSQGFGKISVCSPRTSAMHEVTQVRVDKVFDTQRRRRDKLIDPAPAIAAVAQ